MVNDLTSSSIDFLQDTNTSPQSLKHNCKMSDGDRETKPFKFVTGMLCSSPCPRNNMA